VRIVRNIGLVNKRKRRGRLFVAAGLIMLLGSALPLLTSNESLVFVAYIALGFGFIFFIVGVQHSSKWSRKPRIDVQMDTTLARLNDRYAIIHYPELGSNSPEHVVVTPGGVIVLTALDVSGKVKAVGKRWTQNRLFIARFFNLGAPQLGNPTVENEYQMDRVEQLFDEKVLAGDIEGAIVFMQPNVEVELHEEESTVLHISELYDFVREVGSGVSLSNQERNEIIEALSVGTEIETTAVTPTRRKKRIKAA
jgi:hypothetical protein